MVEHKHLIVRAEVKKPIVDTEIAKDFLKRLVDSIGMVITKSGGPYADYVDKPGNCGIAAFAMIETSHCAMHVWDQESPPLVQLDVYSCNNYNTDIVLDFINEMEPTSAKYFILDRKKALCGDFHEPD